MERERFIVNPEKSKSLKNLLIRVVEERITDLKEHQIKFMPSNVMQRAFGTSPNNSVNQKVWRDALQEQELESKREFKVELTNRKGEKQELQQKAILIDDYKSKDINSDLITKINFLFFLFKTEICTKKDPKDYQPLESVNYISATAMDNAVGSLFKATADSKSVELETLRPLASFCNRKWDKHYNKKEPFNSFFIPKPDTLKNIDNQRESVIPIEGIWRIYRFSADGKTIGRKWLRVDSPDHEGNFEGINYFLDKSDQIMSTKISGFICPIKSSQNSGYAGAEIWISAQNHKNEDERFSFAGSYSPLSNGDNTSGHDKIIRGIGIRIASINGKKSLMDSPFSMLKLSQEQHFFSKRETDLQLLSKVHFTKWPSIDNSTNNNKDQGEFDAFLQGNYAKLNEDIVLKHLSLQPARPSLRHAYSNPNSLYFSFTEQFKISTYVKGWLDLLGRGKFTEIMDVFCKNSSVQLDYLTALTDPLHFDNSKYEELKKLCQWVSISTNYDIKFSSNATSKNKVSNNLEKKNLERYNIHYWFFIPIERENAIFSFRIKMSSERIISRYFGEVTFSRSHLFLSMKHFLEEPSSEKNAFPNIKESYTKVSWVHFSEEVQNHLKDKTNPNCCLELLSSSIISVGEEKNSHALRELLIPKSKLDQIIVKAVELEKLECKSEDEKEKIKKLKTFIDPFLSLDQFLAIGKIEHYKNQKWDQRLRISYEGHCGLSYNTKESSHFVKENRVISARLNRNYIVLSFHLNKNKDIVNLHRSELLIDELGHVEYIKEDNLSEGTVKKLSHFNGWSELQNYIGEGVEFENLNIQLRKRFVERFDEESNSTFEKIDDGVRIRLQFRFEKQRKKLLTSMNKKNHIESSYAFLGSLHDFDIEGWPCSSTAFLIDKNAFDKWLKSNNIEDELKVTRKSSMYSQFSEFLYNEFHFNLQDILSGCTGNNFLEQLLKFTGGIYFKNYEKETDNS